jgi:hypothetical protein
MTKKCGIVTFHRAHNYGAVLQAFALQEIIKNKGFDVCIVDEQHPNLEEGYRLYPSFNSITSFRRFLSFFKRWMTLALDYKRKKERFLSFEKFINEYLVLNSSEKRNQYDYLILGSDQIWNAEYTSGLYPLYYGDIKGVKTNKIISYAASMGVGELSPTQESDFKEKLKKIDRIGVREEKLKIYVCSKGFKADVNLDPTLLLSAKEWNKFALELKNSSCINYDKPYLLLYEVHEHSNTNYIAKKIAANLNLEVVRLAPKVDYSYGDDVITGASPNEFLALFKNSEFIITTSFHGTVFSVIYNKQFLTMKFNSDVDIRSEGLLKKVGLENRLLSNLEYDMPRIDYTDVKQKLNKLREESLSYLNDSLGA